jgi:hypothetical protein
VCVVQWSTASVHADSLYFFYRFADCSYTREGFRYHAEPKGSAEGTKRFRGFTHALPEPASASRKCGKTQAQLDSTRVERRVLAHKHRHAYHGHVHGARLRVHGARLHVHGARLHVHGARLHVNGAQLRVHGAQLRVHGARLHAHSTGTKTPL